MLSHAGLTCRAHVLCRYPRSHICRAIRLESLARITITVSIHFQILRFATIVSLENPQNLSHVPPTLTPKQQHQDLRPLGIAAHAAGMAHVPAPIREPQRLRCPGAGLMHDELARIVQYRTGPVRAGPQRKTEIIAVVHGPRCSPFSPPFPSPPFEV
jgi:hypothetical protein